MLPCFLFLQLALLRGVVIRLYCWQGLFSIQICQDSAGVSNTGNVFPPQVLPWSSVFCFGFFGCFCSIDGQCLESGGWVKLKDAALLWETHFRTEELLRELLGIEIYWLIWETNDLQSKEVNRNFQSGEIVTITRN